MARRPGGERSSKAKKAPTAMKTSKDYAEKRSFDRTPEPAPSFRGNVDPTTARQGKNFVIHQHHATRLHFDLRLEMFNGKTPVLVSWAVPKNLPRKKGVRSLAIHVEDHPFEYGTFTGTIPDGNYGAGEVRIFDSGDYEMLDREPAKLTFRLRGKRLRASYHLVHTKAQGKGDQWLVLLKDWEGPAPENPPEPGPMLATLVPEPFDNEGWAFEPKWDGIRAIAVCDGSTRLISRNSKDISVAYPELSGIHERLVSIDAMVDGEIVAMSEGHPSFELLQQRMHVREPKEIEKLSKRIPVTYVAFDLLYLDGKTLVNEPFQRRRELLEEAVVASDHLQLSPSINGDGIALFEAAKARNLEGIVAKKLNSKYEVGRRSRTWVKIKTVFDADVVVAGWTSGQRRRAGSIGALILGAYDGDVLRYIGAVGTGFDAGSLAVVEEALAPLGRKEPPFEKQELAPAEREVRKAHWVKPELVVAVEFRQLTSAGKLRAPSFKGIREDKSPEECRFEDLSPPPPYKR